MFSIVDTENRFRWRRSLNARADQTLQVVVPDWRHLIRKYNNALVTGGLWLLWREWNEGNLIVKWVCDVVLVLAEEDVSHVKVTTWRLNIARSKLFRRKVHLKQIIHSLLLDASAKSNALVIFFSRRSPSFATLRRTAVSQRTTCRGFDTDEIS